ncbi:MAG: AMP-binding protein [Thermomicrobiales bacterium]
MASPGDPALITAGRVWTYAALRDESRRRAAVLHAAGFVAGDVLVTTAPITDDVLITCLACCRLDLVFCHLSPQYTAAEVGQLVARAGARAVLTVDGTAHPLLGDLSSLPLALPGVSAGQPVVGDLPRRESPEAPAVLATTSGTTAALPKLAIVPHRAYTWRQRSDHWMEDRAGATCSTTKSFNSMLRQFCVSLVNGNAHLISHFQAPARLEQELVEHRVTLLIIQPPLLQLLVRNQQPPSPDLRLEVIRVGAAPLTPELAAAARQRFAVPVVPSSASTESQATIVMPVALGPAESVGMPYDAVDIRIVDDDGRDLPVGEVGELLVRTPGLMLGYLGDDAATADTIRDGWHWTGDLASRDSAGYVFLRGRRSLQINVGGLKVTPDEVEATLLRHPDVREVVALGTPDAGRGEVVRVVICPAIAESSLAELRRFCRRSLAPHKVPRVWEFRDELPRSPLGKVLRNKL